MDPTQKVSFLSSITTKVTLVLLASFMIVIAIVLYVVSNEGHKRINVETDKVAMEAGKLAISVISTTLDGVENDAQKIKILHEVSPPQFSIFNKKLLQLVNDQNDSSYLSTNIVPNSTKNLLVGNTTSIGPLSEDGENRADVSENSVLTNKKTWLNIIKVASDNNCFWSHLYVDSTNNKPSLSCSLNIERDENFLGIANIDISTASITKVLDGLDYRVEKSYAVLLDNSNQIIASSDAQKLPVMNASTGKPYVLEELIQQNEAWIPVANTIKEIREKTIEENRAKLDFKIYNSLFKIDTASKTAADSMLINYAANQRNLDKQNALEYDGYLKKLILEDDELFGHDSLAYVFEVPKTSWKLVIVQSKKQVNSIANSLSKDILKYIVVTLLLVLTLIFFLLDFLALRPMQETVYKITQAITLIDKNKYHLLAEIKFPKLKAGKVDELGVVNGSLKKLLQRIEYNEGKLANINQELENKVEARTAELQDAMNELKSSQIQLIRSEKMATLGQMVAGVAHEVNTPLSYVQNNVEIIGQLTEQYEELETLTLQLKDSMMSEDASENDIEETMSTMIALAEELKEDDISSELKDLIQDSLFGVGQIAEMVLNLRNFSRLDESNVKQTDIAECVNTSIKIAQNSLKANSIEINTELNDIPSINCAASQINQVVINLINNAAHAIGDKPDGKINIRTSFDEHHVYIDVKDNGSGMSDEIVKKIFEPFFTTKGSGEGTGLGMAICQQIMQQHGGSIKVKSALNVGTLFRLTFPLDVTLTI